MEQLETKGTQKRRMPKVRTMVLAAALAVGCLLSIAAAANLPARVYNFVTGGRIVYTEPGQGSLSVDANAPIRAEDGRLWFEVDGQAIDITSMVDENTPYIYEHTDPDTGEKGCVVVGGTMENFGWTEFSIIDGEIMAVLGQNYADSMVRLPDGSEVNRKDLTDEQWKQLTERDDGNPALVAVREVIHPWLQAALDQLGLEWWLP